MLKKKNMRDRARSMLCNEQFNGNIHINRIEIWPHTVRSRLCNGLFNGNIHINRIEI